MAINLDPKLESELRERAQAEGLTISAYLERILQEDRLAMQEIESFVMEGLNSGEAFAPGPDYWEEKRRRLNEEYSNKVGCSPTA